MVKCAICDDEKAISDKIRELTLKVFLENELRIDITTYNDSEKMYYEIRDGIRYDLVILDIEMPQYDGMQIAEILKKTQPECMVIFLTSHKKYAIDAFELEIFRYIPKDEIEIRFEKYVAEAARQLKVLCENSYIIQKKNSVEKLPYKDIRYIKRSGKNTVFMCTDNREAKERKAVTSVIKELNTSEFLVIDRGCAVNICYISKIDLFDLFLKNGERLPVSRANTKKVVETLTKYWEGKS